MRSIYLAGIIQGGKQGTNIHAQDYRERLKKFLKTELPSVEIYCPVEAHPNSEHYDYDKGKGVFFKHMNWPKEVDVVVAYLPEASMGTAIELWNARESGKARLVISPLKNNWVVKYLATKMFDSIEDFEGFVINGGMDGYTFFPRY